MNNTKLKTLIITQAVAAFMLDIVRNIKDTTSETITTADNGDSINDVDGIRIVHFHSEFGSQTLLADRIHDKFFAVSFAGSEAFLEQIGSENWKSNVMSLSNYLMSVNPELVLDLDALNTIEIAGTDYVIFLMGEDESFDVNDPALVKLFGTEPAPATMAEEFDASIEAKVVEIVNTVCDGVDKIVQSMESAPEEAADVTADAVDATVDQAEPATAEVQEPTEPKLPFREKARQFVNTRRGAAVCAVAVIAVAVTAKICIANYFDVEVPEL